MLPDKWDQTLEVDEQDSVFTKPNEADKKCAPGQEFDNGSCIAVAILVEMVKAYNKENPKTAILLSNTVETLNPKKYKRYLIYQIKKRLTQCTDQVCWTKQSFIDKMSKKREQLIEQTFRPDGPQGKFEWLNTLHIEKGMTQYQRVYKDFKFLGAVPIDFDDLPVLGIKDLNLMKLYKAGTKRIGIVFNLDPHYKGGSHWVGLFSDLEKGTVYYYDSYAVPPEPQIRKFMRRLYNFIKDYLKNPNALSDFNKQRAQYKDSNCGVYSMNFILRNLKGENFEKICSDKLSDEKVGKCRKVYFNNDPFKSKNQNGGKKSKTKKSKKSRTKS